MHTNAILVTALAALTAALPKEQAKQCATCGDNWNGEQSDQDDFRPQGYGDYQGNGNDYSRTGGFGGGRFDLNGGRFGVNGQNGGYGQNGEQSFQGQGGGERIGALGGGFPGDAFQGNQRFGQGAYGQGQGGERFGENRDFGHRFGAESENGGENGFQGDSLQGHGQQWQGAQGGYRGSESGQPGYLSGAEQRQGAWQGQGGFGNGGGFGSEGRNRFAYGGGPQLSGNDIGNGGGFGSEDRNRFAYGGGPQLSGNDIGAQIPINFAGQGLQQIPIGRLFPFQCTTQKVSFGDLSGLGPQINGNGGDDSEQQLNDIKCRLFSDAQGHNQIGEEFGDQQPCQFDDPTQVQSILCDRDN
ncbi:Hypothetical predicted protein [Lecanosticta acicola]|uniref:Uncharacterized protein n=1 Tax=Lecanosticta acicola TaxID=111012 RepID=A0AAI8YT41_9PEZI|nr:Hypothetical predicted protein [Lecanosticta acicola]